MVDSVSFRANNAYQTAASDTFGKGGPDLNENAYSFHKVFNENLAKFSAMSSQDIIRHITRPDAVSTTSSRVNGGIVTDVLRNARKQVKEQEIVTQKALMGEASLTDLITTTNRAKHTIQTFSTIMERAIQSFEKILSMPM